MFLVKETIPGAGENWTIPPVLERMKWLTENTTGSFKAWWGSNSRDTLTSDEHNISFELEEDATAYVLKWK
jgi:hypothetical protein